jgi:hypothetical protein
VNATNGQVGKDETAAAAKDIHELAKQQIAASHSPVKPTRTKVFPNLRKSILAQPAVFEVWYRTRAWRHLLTRGMRSFTENGPKDADGQFLGEVASYNKSQMWEWHRVRTEKLMAVLRCIDDMPARPRILVIGPRNEAELLLLNLYRFPFEDIEAIDIFSYSPLIKLQDMHDIQFPDGTFDVVYSAWTLPYAHDLGKVVREVVRVLKPGGIVAAGYSVEKAVSTIGGQSLQGGNDLKALFQPYVDWMYWQESLPLAHSNEITTIFRIKKNAKAADAE